jgi:hypothetical protein
MEQNKVEEQPQKSDDTWSAKRDQLSRLCREKLINFIEYFCHEIYPDEEPLNSKRLELIKYIRGDDEDNQMDMDYFLYACVDVKRAFGSLIPEIDIKPDESDNYKDYVVYHYRMLWNSSPMKSVIVSLMKSLLSDLGIDWWPTDDLRRIIDSDKHLVKIHRYIRAFICLSLLWIETDQ